MSLLDRLSDEADLCRNEGADDIANLLDEARAAIEATTVKGDGLVERLREALTDLCESVEREEETNGSLSATMMSDVRIARQALGSTDNVG